MRVYLVRHGECVSSDIDPNQPLSSWGHTEVEEVAKFLGVQNIPLNHIYHSVKVRAKETAAILHREIAPEIPVEEREGLKPMDPIENWLPELNALEEPTMLVGHLPFMERLFSQLVLGTEKEGVIDFCGSAVVALERTGTEWKLLWCVTPKLVLGSDRSAEHHL